MCGGKRGEEVVFECAYRAFCTICTMCMRGDKLDSEAHAVEVRFEFTRGFIVQTNVFEVNIMICEEGKTLCESTHILVCGTVLHG